MWRERECVPDTLVVLLEKKQMLLLLHSNNNVHYGMYAWQLSDVERVYVCEPSTRNSWSWKGMLKHDVLFVRDIWDIRGLLLSLSRS
jgi:hypothetical protein